MDSSARESRVGLWLIITYLFLEYVRPQSFMPGLTALRIPMLVQIAIILQLLRCNFDNLRSKESILFLLLMSLMALHVPLATNNYWAYWITRNMALQFIVFLGIIGTLRTFEKLNFVLTFWLIITVLCGIKGFFEGGRIPGSGFLGDENDFSLFLNMMIPLAFFKAYTASTKKIKLLFYSGVVALILGTVSSMSRGGFLGLVPPLLYCWWKTPGKIKSALGASLIGLLLVVYIIPSSYWREMETISQEGTATGTGSQRAYLWELGFQMFMDHPLVGVGPGNFNWNLKGYEPYEGFEGRSQAGRPAHSIYFTLLPELGLVGGFLFFGMIWANRKEGLRLARLRKRAYAARGEAGSKSWEKIEKLEAIGHGLTGAIIAYLISGAFLSVLYYGHFWLIMGFSVAKNNLTKDLLERIDTEPESPPGDRLYENSSDGWQYARSSGDYQILR